MTEIIISYVSQFYPLVIGVMIFALLKSINLLKHKTRIDLDTPVAKDDGRIAEGPNGDEVADVKDLLEERYNSRSFYRYAYSGLGTFNSYITRSDAPRMAAFSSIVRDRLIMNGMPAKRLSESGTLHIAASRFGIIDLYRCNGMLDLIRNNEKLEIAFPEKETLLNHLFRQDKTSGTLLRFFAGYNISMVG